MALTVCAVSRLLNFSSMMDMSFFSLRWVVYPISATKALLRISLTPNRGKVRVNRRRLTKYLVLDLTHLSMEH